MLSEGESQRGRQSERESERARERARARGQEQASQRDLLEDKEHTHPYTSHG